MGILPFDVLPIIAFYLKYPYIVYFLAANRELSQLRKVKWLWKKKFHREFVRLGQNLSLPRNCEHYRVYMEFSHMNRWLIKQNLQSSYLCNYLLASIMLKINYSFALIKPHVFINKDMLYVTIKKYSPAFKYYYPQLVLSNDDYSHIIYLTIHHANSVILTYLLKQVNFTLSSIDIIHQYITDTALYLLPSWYDVYVKINSQYPKLDRRPIDIKFKKITLSNTVINKLNKIKDHPEKILWG